MICKKCGKIIYKSSASNVKDNVFWYDEDDPAFRWIVCNSNYARTGDDPIYHAPLILTDEEIIAGLRGILCDL